ncbi:dihydroneopterin aldolase [Rhodobacteraceae bacterium SC52]|nr:dihydroneopterin aldolase [Rhodobacteraceae bacterium SC52]
MTNAAALSAPSPEVEGDTRAAPDRIFLKDHVVDVEIGAFQAERGMTQRVRFTLIAELMPAPRAALSAHGPRDDVDTILSYDVLLDAIHDEIAGGRINLLETLAEGIAARVLVHAGVTQIQIVIEKLDRVPGSLGVDITRHRPRTIVSDLAPSTFVSTPRLAVISQDMLAAPDLPDRLAALAEGGPLILCVDAPATPEAGLPVPVQRRVDLLSYEQAAWRLAARDASCVVVDSRTELDWGLRNGQISVWAPSKMVVDARENAPSGPVSMAMLVPWLARQMAIGTILTLGTVALEDTAGLDVQADD